MSLNTWSLIVFGAVALLYIMVYSSMFQKSSIKKFVLLIIAWVIHMVTILWYGIATNQIGFILWFALELLVIYFVYVITGKVFNNDSIQSE
jgi:hypothetical protein